MNDLACVMGPFMAGQPCICDYRKYWGWHQLYQIVEEDYGEYCVYIWSSKYAVWCCYNAVSFLQNIHYRHVKARPWGRGMDCLLWWVQALMHVLPWSLQWYMHHLVILPRVKTTVHCIYNPLYNTWKYNWFMTIYVHSEQKQLYHDSFQFHDEIYSDKKFMIVSFG